MCGSLVSVWPLIIPYLDQPYYLYNSNPDYCHIPLNYPFIPGGTDYQSTPEVTGQETKETNYIGTETKGQTGSKNYNWS